MSHSSPRRLPFVMIASLVLLSLPAQGRYYELPPPCHHDISIPITPGPVANCEPGTAPSDFQGAVSEQVVYQGVGADGHPFAQLKTTSFEVETDHPVYGHIHISLDPSRPIASSLWSQSEGGDYPVVHTTRLNVTAVAENLPGIVLRNQQPIEFVGKPTDSWPAPSNVYTLQSNVVFEDRDNPGPVLVTACAGQVGVSTDSGSGSPTVSVSTHTGGQPGASSGDHPWWASPALAALPLLALGGLLARRRSSPFLQN